MRPGLRAACLLVALRCSAALACGYCIEDKIATVYDYETVTRAHRAGHYVAFFAIDGALAADDESRRHIERTLESIPGVDAGSVKVSLPDSTVSFAFDPVRESREAVFDVANAKLADRGLKLQLLRVMEPPASAA